MIPHDRAHSTFILIRILLPRTEKLNLHLEQSIIMAPTPQAQTQWFFFRLKLHRLKSNIVWNRLLEIFKYWSSLPLCKLNCQLGCFGWFSLLAPPSHFTRTWDLHEKKLKYKICKYITTFFQGGLRGLIFVPQEVVYSTPKVSTVTFDFEFNKSMGILQLLNPYLQIYYKILNKRTLAGYLAVAQPVQILLQLTGADYKLMF